ncbi:MAG: glycosyltransferase family 4 protein [Candidatus Competibacteraceae bacterium]|nr:glycosyltransferase family 4 protein [Candidatus Competibacteraceae bacterium]
MPPEPSPPELLAQRRQELAVPPDAPSWWWPSALHPVKGFDDLLTALCQRPMATLAGRPTYLIIVGDSPLNQALQHLSERLGIARRVRWTGWQRDLAAFKSWPIWWLPLPPRTVGQRHP